MNSNIRQFSLNIIAALIPAISCAIYFFGLEAVRVISLCVITSILCEVGVNIATRTRLTIGNCSAILTGLLLALCLPPKTPSFTAILGSIFAILIVKIPFKKFGKLIFNPVLAARSFLLLFCTSSLVTWTPSSWNVSAGDI